jgi:hypothetical protein
VLTLTALDFTASILVGKSVNLDVPNFAPKYE